MRRCRTFVGICVVATACDRSVDAAAPSAATTPPPPGETTDARTPNHDEAPRDATTPAKSTPTPLVQGDRLEPIATVDGDGKAGCSHCAMQGPMLLVFGSSAALANGETWRDLDAMSRLYADDGLASLAVVAARRDGVLVPGNAADAKATHAERPRLRVAMPVLAASARAGDGQRTLESVPALAHDPTVVLLDQTGTVAWTGGPSGHWQALDRAIVQLVAAATPRAPG